MWDNVYYDPEKFCLTIVLEVERDLSYEFDKFVVWTDGVDFYSATDSGCSCPCPFEDLTLADLKANPRSPYELHGLLDDWAGQSTYDLNPADVVDGHAKISALPSSALERIAA